MSNRPPYPDTPAERFSWIIDGVRAIVSFRAFMRGQDIGTILLRIARLRTRVLWLLAHVAAGTLPPVRRRGPGAAPRRALERRVETVSRRPGWLAAMWPVNTGYANEYRMHGYWLLTLLREPEMAALVARAPERFGRALRPVIAMLGEAIPPELRLPPRERRRRATAAAAAALEDAPSSLCAPGAVPRRGCGQSERADDGAGGGGRAGARADADARQRPARWPKSRSLTGLPDPRRKLPG